MSAFSKLHRPVRGNKIIKGHGLNKMQQVHNQRVPFVPNALNVKSVEKLHRKTVIENRNTRQQQKQ